MSKQPKEQDLMALWQQQDVPEIDATALKKKLTQMRWRQMLYAVGDIFGVVFAIVVISLSRDRMSDAFFYIMSVFVGLSLVFAFYITYLRRFALFPQRSSTREFLTALTEQTRNNIKIARITKHSAWVSWLCLNGIWLILWVVDDMPPDEWLRKFLWMNAITIVLCVPFWLWAQHRQRKFERALVPLEHSLQEVNSAGH